MYSSDSGSSGECLGSKYYFFLCFSWPFMASWTLKIALLRRCLCSSKSSGVWWACGSTFTPAVLFHCVIIHGSQWTENWAVTIELACVWVCVFQNNCVLRNERNEANWRPQRWNWGHSKPVFGGRDFIFTQIDSSWCQFSGNWGQGTRIWHLFLTNIYERMKFFFNKT